MISMLISNFIHQKNYIGRVSKTKGGVVFPMKGEVFMYALCHDDDKPKSFKKALPCEM